MNRFWFNNCSYISHFQPFFPVRANIAQYQKYSDHADNKKAYNKRKAPLIIK
jgi:hypothetical protein